MSQAIPANVEAERSVVGALLLQPRSLPAVSEVLTAADFHHPAWGAVYDALCALGMSGLPIDPLTVLEYMKGAGTAARLNALGGAGALVDAQGSVLGFDGVAYHAKIIAKKAQRRRIILAAQDLRSRGMDEETDDDEFLAAARDVGMGFTLPAKGAKGPRPAAHFLREMLKEIERRAQRVKEGKIAGIPTAFERIDAMLGGLQTGEVLVVGARPGMGKTSMLMGTCINAGRAGVPSLIFSKEMRGVLLWERAASSEGKLPNRRLRRGMLDAEHWAGLQKIAAELAALPVSMDDDSDATIEDIRSRAQRWRMELGNEDPAILGVDYVQLVKTRARTRSRDEEVSEVSRGLKAISKDFNLAVIALASLNREVEKREDKRPKVADLRDSGAIESDADIVAMMYRDEVYNRRTDAKGVAEFIVGKNRNGPTGTAKLKWDGEFTRFEDLPRPKERELDEQEDD